MSLRLSAWWLSGAADWRVGLASIAACDVRPTAARSPSGAPEGALVSDGTEAGLPGDVPRILDGDEIAVGLPGAPAALLGDSGDARAGLTLLGGADEGGR